MGSPLLVCTLATVVLAACATREPLPSACMEARPDDVLRALRAAPQEVALQDGTRISTCVERAVGESEAQVLGATLTTTADRLARRLASSELAAFQLGFLMGATERGAAQTNGVQGELDARIGQAAGIDGGPPARHGALLRGRAAGRRDG